MNETAAIAIIAKCKDYLNYKSQTNNSLAFSFNKTNLFVSKIIF